jgi:hypothetical protein
MNGVNGEEAWASLPEGQRESVLAQIGETIADGRLISAPASMGAPEFMPFGIKFKNCPNKSLPFKMLLSSAVLLPCTDFYDSIKEGVEKAMQDVSP